METTCWCWQRREATTRPVKTLLMDTVWASLFSPQNFGTDVHPFWRICSKCVGSKLHMNAGLFSVVVSVPPNGKGSAFTQESFWLEFTVGCDSLVDGFVENKGQLYKHNMWPWSVLLGNGMWPNMVQPNMAQVCRYLLRSGCLVCAGLRGAMLKAAVDAGRRAFNQSGCKVCKA